MSRGCGSPPAAVERVHQAEGGPVRPRRRPERREVGHDVHVREAGVRVRVGDGIDVAADVPRERSVRHAQSARHRLEEDRARASAARRRPPRCRGSSTRRCRTRVRNRSVSTRSIAMTLLLVRRSAGGYLPPAEMAQRPLLSSGLLTIYLRSRACPTTRSTRLRGLSGVVTGAGRGIGEACAVDARVARRPRPAGGPRRRARSMRSRSRSGVTEARSRRRVTDVREWASASRRWCDACIETFGAIDFVVANAGIGDYSSLDTGDPERWRRVVETNFLGVLHTVRGGVPADEGAAGRGHIVLMASIAGRQTWVGEPVYIATKWAVVGPRLGPPQGGARAQRARDDDRARDGRHAARPRRRRRAGSSSSGSRRSGR